MPTANTETIIRFFERDARRNLEAATDNIRRARERLATMIEELDRGIKRIKDAETNFDKADQLGNLASCISCGAVVVKDIARDASEDAFGARKTLEVLAALNRAAAKAR